MFNKAKDFADFVKESKEYCGEAVRGCRLFDEMGEEHVILEMKDEGETYCLDWMGGTFADGPDYFENVDDLNPKWIDLNK